MSTSSGSSGGNGACGGTLTNGTAGGGGDKKWDLTPYELERTPQEVITDHDSRMALHPECLRNDFMCPICLKLQTNTVTVMGCLHRFCKECIVKALSNSNKECPVCRTKLPNKRYLRPDPNFDMLISRIFPLREEDLEDTDRTSSRSTRQSTRLRTMRFARDASPDSMSSPEKMNDGSDNVSNGLISEKSLAPVEGEVDVVLKPLSQDPGLSPNDWLNQTRYVKTSSSGTVDHIVKYLSLRYRIHFKKKRQRQQQSGVSNDILAVDEDVVDDDNEPVDESLFTLCFPNGPGQFQQVMPEEKLGDIKENFFKGDRPLELCYAYNVRQVVVDDTNPLPLHPPVPPPVSLQQPRNPQQAKGSSSLP